jgi:epoxyqueuosine reductase
MKINKIVKQTAADLNLDLCRITDGSELEKEREILEKRAKSKYLDSNVS